MYKLDLQLFADATETGSAVVGHRVWFLEKDPVPDATTINTPVIGMRSTPDLGSAQNTVEANTLDGIREKNVPGYYPATDVEYTLLLAPSTVKAQLKFINKEVWVFEERENKTSKPEQVGWGIVYKIKVSGLVATGQSPEGLQEMTQSGTLVSDEYYAAFPTYEDEDTGTVTDATWEFIGLQTGKTVEKANLAKAIAMNLRSSIAIQKPLSTNDSQLKK